MAVRAPIASVELLLDPDTEEAVRDDWARLAGAGLSSGGAHTGPSNRPHLSIAVRSAVGDPGPLRALVPELPLRLAPAGLVLFPHGDRTVLARALVPDAALLELHRRVAGLTADWGDPAPHSAPGEWTPHVTLARRLRIADLPLAIERLAPAPRDVRAVALRVWDGATRTVTEL